MNNSSIRVLIVDDEPRARRGVQLLLERAEDVTIVGEAGDGRAAVEQIQQLSPDLVFLDVQMPVLGGFEVLAQIPRERLPAVIFVTAFDEYALKAFEFHAVDYLLKPIEDARFASALERARQQIRRERAESLQSRLLLLLDALRTGRPTVEAARARDSSFAMAPIAVAPASGAGGGSDRADRVVLRNGAEVILLKAEEIDWIEADGDYMKFHVAGKSLLQRETMGNLETRLDPARFRRIHRSTIVNLDRIARLTPAFNGEHVVILKDGTRLKLSKGYQDRLHEWLGHSL